MEEKELRANADRFTGFAGLYGSVRPRPNPELLDLLTLLAAVPHNGKPQLVVDLGCGTGLSTYAWKDRAERVLGVEPSGDMLKEAETVGRGEIHNVTFVQGFSSATGLPDGCADIVTCSQALHWMDPFSTFQEAARILRPGGVFAAYDCDWPPITGSWQAEKRYREWFKEVKAIGKSKGLFKDVKKWDKDTHLSRMQESKQFRFVREIVMHSTEQGDGDRFLGILLSQGGVASVLKSGITEEELGVPALREEFRQLLEDKKLWYWGYRVRIGIK